MKKPWLLALASLLFSLALAEGALRLLGVGRATPGSRWFAGGNHPRFLFQPDAASGYALRPGFRGREVAVSGEFETAVEIDARGHRLQPHPAGGEPGGVVALGDSMTFGEGIEAASTWTALLEAETGIPVVNAGVPGASSAQMVARLGPLLAEEKPRLVLLVAAARWDLERCANPFAYFEGYIVSSAYRDRLTLVGENLFLQPLQGRLGPLSAVLAGHSVLARLTFAALQREEDPPAPALEFTPACLEPFQQGYERAEAAGARFLTVLADSPKPGLERATAELARRLERRGVPFVKLDALLAGQDLAALRYPVDGHWNPRGHAAVAAVLAPEVLRLLSTPPAGADRARPAPTGSSPPGDNPSRAP